MRPKDEWCDREREIIDDDGWPQWPWPPYPTEEADRLDKRMQDEDYDPFIDPPSEAA